MTDVPGCPSALSVFLPSPSVKRVVRCGRHVSDEAWVMCVHVNAIRTARKLSPEASRTSGFVGEALCSECSSRPKPPTESLRLACGGCVRARWKIEGAS